VHTTEDSLNVSIDWRAAPGTAIGPGQTLEGLTVIVDAPTDVYESTGWEAVDDLGGSTIGVLERVPPPPADGDLTGVIVPGGAPYTLSFDTAGQVGRLMFSVAPGDRISLLVNGVTLACASIFVLGPDAEEITAALRVAANQTTFLEPVTITASGTHTLVIDPDGTNTGALALELYLVPPDVTATLVAGTSMTVAPGTPGQNARLFFNATAGQQISVTLANVTIASAAVSLLAPDGSLVTSMELDQYGGMLDHVATPATGTYTLLIDPAGPNVGQVTATLYDSSDTLGSIVAGGPSVTVQTTTAGQNARLSFAGSAGQRVSLLVSPYTVSIFTEVSILAPDGTILSTGPLYSGYNFHEPVTLPVTGMYTILVDPPGSNVGSVTLTLYDVPPDISAPIAIGGGPVTVAVSVPGQNATLTFSGTAGQHITLQLSDVTIASTGVFVRNPDGSTLASTSISAGGRDGHRSDAVGDGHLYDSRRSPHAVHRQPHPQAAGRR